MQILYKVVSPLSNCYHQMKQKTPISGLRYNCGPVFFSLEQRCRIDFLNESRTWKRFIYCFWQTSFFLSLLGDEAKRTNPLAEVIIVVWNKTWIRIIASVAMAKVSVSGYGDVKISFQFSTSESTNIVWDIQRILSCLNNLLHTRDDSNFEGWWENVGKHEKIICLLDTRYLLN